MNKKSHIFIKKTEWERMKRNEKKTNLYDEREKYFQSLIDKSQEMIKTWHDSVQVRNIIKVVY